jgi:site-specific DNA recombinase
MVTAAAVKRLQPERALEAAGYIRVSRKVQAEGHSPEVQREAIKRLARQEGYILTDEMIKEDHERGSKVTRKGYQEIIAAVRDGTIHAVLVFMFDRWGRDGAEWLARAREFERLGVPIISAQEGRDEGGLIRFVRAGMAEEYSRQLARRVLPAREKAAREGTYMGPTPLGYKRVYPAREGTSRRPAGQLEKDKATAWIVQELFARYDGGGWSIRSLVGWLNTDERIEPPAGRERWTSSSIKHLLKNVVYIGMVRYNQRPMGFYERAPKGSSFIVPGKHEALIERDVFERVQRRLAAAARRHSYNRHHGEPLVGAGLFLCHVCGGPMGANRKDDGKAYYECTRRKAGTTCTARGYLATRAHEALLSEVSRLRRAPWTPVAEQRLADGDGDSAEMAATLQCKLTAERERLRKHTRLMSEMEDDPTPEQIAVFREISAEISANIRALEAQLAEAGQRAAHVPHLRELHAKLTSTEVPMALATLAAQGDVEGQRALVQDLIDSACVVDRQPQSHPRWLRVKVTWSADVQTLLDAGLLALDPALAAPAQPSKQERQREYCRRYRERHREERNAARRELRARRRAERAAREC